MSATLPMVLEVDTPDLGNKTSEKIFQKGFKACRLLSLRFALPKQTSLQLMRGIQVFCFRKSHILVKYVSWKSMIWILFPFLRSDQQNNDNEIKEMKPKGAGKQECTVARALASHQCVPDSNPGTIVICGLSLL